MLLYPFSPVWTWHMNMYILETIIMRHFYANMTYPYTCTYEWTKLDMNLTEVETKSKSNGMIISDYIVVLILIKPNFCLTFFLVLSQFL